MTNRYFRVLIGRLAGRRRLATVVGLVAVVIAVVSCSTVHRSVVNLPAVPGAEYVGSKECEQCHGKIYRDFITTADHARLMTPGPNAFDVGCESSVAARAGVAANSAAASSGRTRRAVMGILSGRDSHERARPPRAAQLMRAQRFPNRGSIPGPAASTSPTAGERG
jgi:hypothetical protein